MSSSSDNNTNWTSRPIHFLGTIILALLPWGLAIFIILSSAFSIMIFN
ncbi:hypothetical protein [uncultured Methanobrevibacter sp.]